MCIGVKLIICRVTVRLEKLAIKSGMLRKVARPNRRYLKGLLGPPPQTALSHSFVQALLKELL